MALILSTIDDGRITSSQARAFQQSASQSRDIVISNYGSSFATQSPTGFTAQVGTGMLVCDGAICENTSIQPVTMSTPTAAGVGALVAVVNLANKTFSFKMQNHANSFIRQNLVAMQTGIREIPLYFFSFTTTAITSWNDWRPLGNSAGTPVGTIVAFAGDHAPAGWLLCDGSRQYQVRLKELYDVIGTKYGGGAGMFNLPDLRGKVVVGLHPSDADFSVLGKTGGAKTHTLTESQMPQHAHTMNQIFSANGGAGSKQVIAGYPVTGVGQYNLNTDSSGGGQAHNNMQPYFVMNYIIKY